jgi:hypothetical protein
LQFGKVVVDGLGNMLHRLTVLALQLTAGLREYARGKILELLAHDLQLLLELLTAQTVLGNILLLLQAQRVGHHLGLDVQGRVAAVEVQIGGNGTYHHTNYQ